MDIITCKDVTIYNENTMAVENLSFSIEEGEFVSIVGENGAGKSTLVKALLGLKSVRSGSIVFAKSARGKLGYLPQQSMALRDFPASVSEVVMSGFAGMKKLIPYYGKAQRAEARKSMEMLGIYDVRDKSFKNLSGGQKQRVLLARALCAAEKILLLDEPTAGLDPLVTNDLYTIVKGLQKTNGMTIIMVSHDVASAMKYSDKIMHLRTTLEFFGTPAEYEKTELGEVFGGGVNAD